MMPGDTAILIEGLSKKYAIRAHREPTFRDALSTAARLVAKPRAAMAALSGREDFWALKDVGITIREGEKVGIIGGNGAGKSTLLKVLSRITYPTEGRAVISGRVTSLLEVGTGFHPELTGRENIFLNGSILGMPHSVVRRRMDEIVAFSGVERFLEVPVKRYSSGMKTRLGFAIAAHLDSDILIVDEVLAVGDAEFQKKCIGKMDEVSRSGERTILFVSHDLASVQGLCDTAMLMDSGRLLDHGPVDRVISRYLSDVKSVCKVEYLKPPFSAITVSGERRAFCSQEEVSVEIEVTSDESFEGGVVFTVFDERNRPIISHDGSVMNRITLSRGRNVIVLRIAGSHLVHGDYFMRFRLCGASIDDRIISVADIPAFSIVPEASNTGRMWGVVAPPVSIESFLRGAE